MTHSQRMEALEAMGLLPPAKELFYVDSPNAAVRQVFNSALKPRTPRIRKRERDTIEKTKRVAVYREQFANDNTITYLPWKGVK